MVSELDGQRNNQPLNQNDDEESYYDDEEDSPTANPDITAQQVTSQKH